MSEKEQDQTKSSASFSSRVPVGVLQRKCACGTHAMAGECKGCSTEHHATLSRKAVSGKNEVPAVVHDVLRSPGQPLDATGRSFFESHFNQDFSRVRVHTDSKAAESARAVNALAYTVGNKVVFGAGQYVPHTPSGRGLLAHELTHVMHAGNAPVGSNLEIGSSTSAEEHLAEHNETLARPAAAQGAFGSGRWQLERKGVTPGGFFANIGRGIASLFGAEPDYDDKTLKDYLQYLKDHKDIEDDHDSDNKACAVVRKDMFQAEGFAIWVLLIQELLSGVTGDDDEQAIIKIFENAKPDERNRLADTIGYERLYDKVDGVELDRLYALLPMFSSFKPRGKTQHAEVSMADYIKKWEMEQGHKMTNAERQVLAAGCIGITALNLGVFTNPDLSECYATFKEAWDHSRTMNEFLSANQPDRRAVIFSKRFWSGGKKYEPDPKTRRVDLSGHHDEPRDFEGAINFDYGFLDEKTGKWWHANHCDPGTLGPAECDMKGPMKAYESDLQHYSRPLKDFDKQVFCVGISTR
jgi:hypothetical protein